MEVLGIGHCGRAIRIARIIRRSQEHVGETAFGETVVRLATSFDVFASRLIRRRREGRFGPNRVAHYRILHILHLQTLHAENVGIDMR